MTGHVATGQTARGTVVPFPRRPHDEAVTAIEQPSMASALTSVLASIDAGDLKATPTERAYIAGSLAIVQVLTDEMFEHDT